MLSFNHRLLLVVLSFLLSIVTFTQKNDLKARFVVEEGKFIFDKESYEIYNKRILEAKEYDRKMAIYYKQHPQYSYSKIDCATLRYPRFDSATAVFFKEKIHNLNLKKTKLGKNTFSILIDKHGKVLKFSPGKISDKHLVKQIKEILYSKAFSRWNPAVYYTTKVNYNYRFSVVVDSTFYKYNLKHKWSQESNLNEFIP